MPGISQCPHSRILDVCYQAFEQSDSEFPRIDFIESVCLDCGSYFEFAVYKNNRFKATYPYTDWRDLCMLPITDFKVSVFGDSKGHKFYVQT